MFAFGRSSLNLGDVLTGGFTSKLGLFSLGIIPYINASIVMQLIASIFPNVKKLQNDEGPSGRRKFSQIQKVLTLLFAVVQAVGQLNYLSTLVSDFSFYWVLENSIALASGAMTLTFLAEALDKLKLGNGTSIIVFTNILSNICNGDTNQVGMVFGEIPYLFVGLSIVAILGIVCVQEAERKIPIYYASRYCRKVTYILNNTSYLPLKMNATGVMPIVFTSTVLALPYTLSRYSDYELLQKVALFLGEKSLIYTPLTIGLIFLFNYLYTFLQFDPV
jgi:preprotein translocase subunit SecY